MALDPQTRTALAESGGRIMLAADALGISPGQLLDRLMQAGLGEAICDSEADAAAKAKRSETWSRLADNEAAILANLDSASNGPATTAGDKLQAAQAKQREQWLSKPTEDSVGLGKAKPAEPPTPAPAPVPGTVPWQQATPPPGFAHLTDRQIIAGLSGGQVHYQPLPGMAGRLEHMSDSVRPVQQEPFLAVLGKLRGT